MRSKGQYLEIDAIVAISILILGLIYLRTLTSSDAITKPLTHYSVESVKLLRTLKTSDLDASLLTAMQSSQFSSSVDVDYNLGRQIGVMYIVTEAGSPTSEEADFDKDMVQFALDSQIPQEFGYGVWLQDDVDPIYVRGSLPTTEQDIGTAKMVIAGIDPYVQAQGGNPFQDWPTILEVRVWG